MAYAKHAETELKKIADAPNVTEDHARALLAGTLLHVEVNSDRKWPVFSLYKNKAARMRLLETVEEAMKDPEGTEIRVREQRDMEYRLSMANRYDIGDDDDDDDGDGDDEKGSNDGSGSGDDDDDDDDEVRKRKKEKKKKRKEMH